MLSILNSYKKLSSFKRFILKLLNVYALDRETLNLVNPNYKNSGNNIYKINNEISMIVEGSSPSTMAKSTGLAIIELSNVLSNLKPDFVLTIADRYETISTAITASYMNIPVAHTQGGEVTGSIDESVRHAITKLSHIHFPATKLSKKNTTTKK